MLEISHSDFGETPPNGNDNLRPAFAGTGLYRHVPARHVLAILSFLGCLNLFTLRVNLSVALVAMVNYTLVLNTSPSNDECGLQNSNGSQAQEAKDGEFNWDEQLQGHVLGSFFYGYCLTQVLGGWLAELVGGKRTFGFSVLVTSILTLVTPTAASLHVYALIVVRVLQGMAQGFAFPSIHSLWSKWAPVKERSRLVAFTYAGAQAGTVLAMPVTGVLCQHGFAGGWPSAFYVFGCLGIAWCVAWAVMVSDSPARHPHISSQERDYILKSVGCRETHLDNKKLKPPWGAVLSTPAVWAIVGAHIAYDWGGFTSITLLPQFMKQVLKFDIQENGGLSALPYVVLWLANIASGPIADGLRSRRYSTKVTRKIMNSIGLFVPAVLMLGVGYVGCDPVLAVTLLTLGVGMSGFTLSGFSVNHIDIAPRFAGILMGISNSFGTTTGFIGPLVVGVLTKDNPSMGQWRLFFFITSAIYACGGIVFLIFSEGEEVEWSKHSGNGSKSLRNGIDVIIPPPVIKECHIITEKKSSGINNELKYTKRHVPRPADTPTVNGYSVC
ncbi:sialin-like [Haliotis rufescens]|uniref:sialin-like n=1 Tax=Haliotis rufescens TaxID=6454 RepID=UPI001EB05B44|nr:sialin-like [Haliotis rufescens]